MLGKLDNGFRVGMRRQPIACISLLVSARLRYSSTSLSDQTQLRDFHSSLSFCSESLKLSAKTGSLLQGKRVHATATKLGLCNVLSLQNHLLNVYVKCKTWQDAHQLFDEMRVRNSVAWNTVICGLVGKPTCFDYFRGMLLGNFALDSITINALLRACVELDVIETGRQLHCFVVKLGFELNCFVVSAVVDFYGQFGLAKEARCAFDGVLKRDLVLWNVMLSCYALNRLPEDAFRVFCSMREENHLIPDGFTFSSLLNSCGYVECGELGRQIHGMIIKLSFDADVLVASGVIDMYAKNGCMLDARKAFDGMTARNLVSWNTMIVGYGQHGEGHAAMMLLREMLQDDVFPDELTISATISSWNRGVISSVSEIAQIHGYVIKKGFQGCSSVITSLIDAYSKNGRFSSALVCFRSALEPDLASWTAMINACGFHNCPRYSIAMFEKMVSDGVRPDRIAFLGILSACSQAGLVNEGVYFFNLMINQYQLIPGREHYSCLVDLLGRAGYLDDAFKILKSIPFQHGSDTWGAFLGACNTHGDLGLAKSAADMVFKLEPNDPVSYALMSNMYASGGQWTEVAKLRKLLNNNCEYKLPGCSWTEPAETTILSA